MTEEIKRRFEEYSLGIVTTQSLSEPATQMTMRSYHFAASADIDNVTTVYLLENSKEKAEKLATEIAESKLENVISDIDYELLDSRVKVSLDKASLDKLYLTPEEIITGVIKKFVKKYKSSLSKNKIYFEDVKSYSEFRILKQKLLNLHIKGVKGAKETLILNRDGEWIIQVRGGSFKKIIYGIMKYKSSVLTKLNFEETVKLLFDSAILNRKDKLNTAMANLMINQLSPIGTGTVKLRWKL